MRDGKRGRGAAAAPWRDRASRSDLFGADRVVLDRDRNGHEMARGQTLVLLERDRFAALSRDGRAPAQSQMLEGLDLVLVRMNSAEEKEPGTGRSPAGGAVAIDRNHVYRPGAAERALPASVPRPPADYLDLSHLRAAAPIRLGLIDTALAKAHDTLKNADLHHRDFVGPAHGRPHAHGTAVASILVGQTADYRGIVPHAKLYAASVFFSDAEGQAAATTDSLVLALDWLVRERIPVINMSLTGPPNAVLERAIERAAQNGVMIVASVGNGGPAAPPAYPAAYRQVIGITAVDQGRTAYRLAARGRHVELAAPGVDILCASEDGRFASRSGTSMAAPFAAALLATARAARPSDPAALRRQLRRHAQDLGEEGFDLIYGHGLLRWVWQS